MSKTNKSIRTVFAVLLAVLLCLPTLQLKAASGSTFEAEWSKFYGGIGVEYLYSHVPTSDGGYIAAGYTNGDVGSTTNLGGTDGWVIKVASDGTVEWSKQYGTNRADTLQEIRPTSDGGYIIAGKVSSTDNRDAWLLKISSDGTEEWSQRYAISATYESIYSVQQTSDGGYIAAGLVQSEDGFILKVTNDGTQEWLKRTVDFTGKSIIQTSDGGYISLGSAAFGSLNYQKAGVLKLTSDGTVEWLNFYRDATLASINSSYANIGNIIQTSDGGYIAVTDAKLLGASDNDGYVLKIASDGTQEWAKLYSGTDSDRLRSIQQTSDGGYIAAGSTYGNVGTTTSFGGEDGWILKITNDGTQEWSKQFGDKSLDYLFSIIQTNDGSYVAVGYSWRPTPLPAGTDVEGWIIKLSEAQTLEFDLNGATGVAPDSQTVFIGSTATLPAEPIRTDYTFMGWNTSADGTGTTWDFATAIMPANNIILYAQWESNVDPIVEYTLQFNLNGGHGVAPVNQILQEGQTAQQPTNPARDGYTFEGWQTANGTSWDFLTTTMPASDVILYAQWKEVKDILTPVNPNLPETGNDSNVLGLSVVMIAIATSLLVINKKQQQK